MNAALLRILVTAAARAAEQGTLVEIVETAARLMALVRPLVADADPRADDREAQPSPGALPR